MWAQDDSKLYSIGSEGAVYEWSMTSGERIEELVLKDSALTGIVLSVDGATAYCVSKHGRVHEIKEGAVGQTNYRKNRSQRWIVLNLF